MHINITGILVICILAGLAYWVNDQLNYVPILKTIVRVVIVVVAVLLFLQSCGLIGNHTSISVS